MKLSLAALTTIFATATAGSVRSISQVKADSKFGMELLSKARRAEENKDGEDGEMDTTWIAGYALKFQGCHHISQWNAEANGEDDVRIETKRLARFRLCPVNSCSSNSGSGCSSSFGDYIVDMDTFLMTYMENKQEVEEQECEYYAENSCNCVDNGDDAFDEEACKNNCFSQANMSYCVDEEEEEQGYYGYNQAPKVEVNDYLECAQYQAGGRRLEEDNGNGEYFIGPYCSDQGGKIVLGMFTDDTCTEFADEYGGKMAFQQLTGQSLPYSTTSIVDTSCYTCTADNNDENQNNNGNYYQQAEPKDACVEMYETAGKCESKLYNELGSNVNENACTYMEGIKITRSNGIIISGAATKNKVASAFIGMFSVSFVLLGSYVYYLKTKLDRGSVNLSD